MKFFLQILLVSFVSCLYGQEKNKDVSTKKTETSEQDKEKLEYVLAESVMQEQSDDEVLAFVDQIPEYPGGSMEMMKFISKNIKFPEKAKTQGISGKCFLQFVVTKSGKIENIKVIKSVVGCSECDEEAIRVVKAMPLWKPGIYNGKPVSCYYNLPINITYK